MPFRYLQEDNFKQNCHVQKLPFNFLTSHHILSDADKPEFERDYPKYNEAGFLPYNPDECGPAINALVNELTTKEFADYAGQALEIENLSQYPTLITLCYKFNKRFGTIHTDSKSKIATALLYMNETWPDTSDGCLRFLRSANDIEDQIGEEMKPLYGNFSMFRRSDNSFHGHYPYEGERRVIQIAWVVNEDAKNRKNKRGRFTRSIKKLFGGLDQKVGAGRDKNAAHMD